MDVKLAVAVCGSRALRDAHSRVKLAHIVHAQTAELAGLKEGELSQLRQTARHWVGDMALAFGRQAPRLRLLCTRQPPLVARRAEGRRSSDPRATESFDGRRRFLARCKHAHVPLRPQPRWSCRWSADHGGQRQRASPCAGHFSEQEKYTVPGPGAQA